MAIRGDKAENLIENVAGCGLFQVTLMLILVPAVKPLVSFSIMVMAYGSYNPGWMCMDNATGSVISNDTLGIVIKSSPAPEEILNIHKTETDEIEGGMENYEYVFESCELFQKCQDVRFNPHTTTVVSEWGLICDRAWIPKLMISVQMLGMLIGSYASGLISDRVGRKKTLFIGVAATSTCHLVSSFSVSWIMFLVLRFFSGVSVTMTLVVLFLYTSEFMTRKWRAVIIAIPIWYVGVTLMAFVAWMFKDWRNIERVGCVLNGLCLIPIVFWVPESLRWLEVKNQSREFVEVSVKILKYNGKHASELENIELTERNAEQEEKGDKYNIFDLFRKGYRLISVCIIFLYFSLSLSFYAFSFGAKSLYGDFYLNLFVFGVIPIPFGLLSMLVLKTLTRRLHSLIFLGVSILGSIASIVILLSGNQSAKDFGSTILISISKGTLDGAWMGIYARCTELYPTAVRGLGVGLGSLSARIGGILAPILIPHDKSDLHIFMMVMTGVAVLIALVSVKLPETRGKALMADFSGENKRDDGNDVEVRS